MFTVKQESQNGSKLWPGISHVYAEAVLCTGSVDRVTALFDAGGSLDFDAGPGHQIIYVMNERGSTVGRYDIGNRQAVTLSGLSGPMCADPAALAQAA